MSLSGSFRLLVVREDGIEYQFFAVPSRHAVIRFSHEPGSMNEREGIERANQRAATLDRVNGLKEHTERAIRMLHTYLKRLPEKDADFISRAILLATRNHFSQPAKRFFSNRAKKPKKS